MQLWRQPETPSTLGHSAVVQRVMREEINEQRRVTLDAQRQLHELQAAVVRRQEELQLAQRHLQAFDPSSTTSTIPVSAAKPSAALPSVVENSSPLTKTRPAPADVLTLLKDQVAHQDSYKKRLQHMHTRLAREVQYLNANADLLTQRLKSADKERSLCRNNSSLESNKNRELRKQLRQLQDKRSSFKRSALPVLESYQHELASRLVMTQRRQDADRRRDELLRFIGSRPNGGSRMSTKSLTNASTAIRMECMPIGKLQRRDSYNILAADAEDNKRETLFSVYEGQYARVLRETGEVDLNLVLERFQSYRETTARLREIEIELRAEGARLGREQQAHNAMLSRLRVSGLTDVAERRQRVRDRLEGALHAQQFEKAQVRERVASRLKAFVYVQQGVLHIVELLQCLEDRPGMALASPASLISVARTVVGGAQPADVAVKNVAPALQSLVHLSMEMGRRGLQREWLKLPTFSYSIPQVLQLEQFAPERQTKPGSFPLAEEVEEFASEMKCCATEADEEQRDSTMMRQSIKRQEKETLHEAEVIQRQIADARKVEQSQQPQQKRLSQLQIQLQDDTELVVAHFREQRRAERQEQRFMNVLVAPSNARRSGGTTSIGAQSTRRG